MSATLSSLQSRNDADEPSDRLPHRRLILAAGAVVLIAAVLTWLVAFSSVFGVKTVIVHDTRTLTANQVRTAADVADGTPLVRLDTAAVLHRVEALDDVASAQVQTSFPSTVIITVTERIAVGAVRSGNEYRLVDKTGDQFRSVISKPPSLPLFVVPHGTDAKTTGGAVATVAAALTARQRASIASIQALDPDAITLLLTDQRVVRWGSADRSADKARILGVLLRQHGTQFDLTDPDQPFTR